MEGGNHPTCEGMIRVLGLKKDYITRPCFFQLDIPFPPQVLPNPTDVSVNEAMEAVQFGNMARNIPTMAASDAASAAP